MFINVMTLSDEEKTELGFEKVEFKGDTEDLEVLEALHDEDGEDVDEVNWEKAQIVEMNAETEEERRFRIDPYYIGNGECIHQNCFRGDDS